MKYCTGGILPTELMLRVFELLPFTDMQNVRLVCRHWMHVANLVQLDDDLALRLSPTNCSVVLEVLEETPLTLKNRMRNLRLVGFKDSTQLRAVLEKASSYIRSMHLIGPTIFTSIKQQLPLLHELHLSDMPATDTTELSGVDLSCFPALRSMLLDSSIAYSWRLRLLQLFASPRAPSLKMQHFRFEFERKEQELVLTVLGAHASTLKCLELSYFCNQSLHVARWKRLFERLSNLACLHICGGYSSLWLDGIFHALPSNSPLQQLDLTGCIELEDAGLDLILQKWAKHLKRLSLMFCAGITDASVANLHRTADNLLGLNLSRCHRITGFGLVKGLAKSHNMLLRELYLSDTNNIDETSFCLLIQHLPNLQHLAVGNCTMAVTKCSLMCVYQNLAKLKTLELDHCRRLTDAVLLGSGEHSLERLPHLRHLSLRGCDKLTDQTLCYAIRSNSLRILKLDYCHKMTDCGIEVLVHNCARLEELSVASCTRLSDKAVWHIATGLKRLRSLNLSNCTKLTQCAIDYIAQYCRELRNLSVYGIDSVNIAELENKYAAAN